MKEIQIEKIIKETKYSSVDDKIFNTKEDCEKYEESYLGILKAKYSKIPKKSINEFDLFKFGGSEDYKYSIVKITSKEDIETLLHLENYYIGTHRMEKSMSILEKTFTTGDYVIVGLGDSYSASFIILDTCSDLIEHMKKALLLQ